MCQLCAIGSLLAKKAGSGSLSSVKSFTLYVSKPLTDLGAGSPVKSPTSAPTAIPKG
ncbi:hypothetical protein L1047_11915 [Synechococcus sp. Nb3U1]|uniref:hypothetical protein n=1 Tax=Synechococcus sp. Nb3U1 TaxID=1914529 RepID=UPI001F178DE9|nr:hypothetical protein [Synechococcus sp. Nb3U1]MCF2971901.1 hypothetical protein [Synechococcus sp. Nb3U1]